LGVRVIAQQCEEDDNSYPAHGIKNVRYKRIKLAKTGVINEPAAYQIKFGVLTITLIRKQCKQLITNRERKEPV
jgi:hypothetical protein